MLKRNQLNELFVASDVSTVRMKIEPDDIRPSPEAVARYFGGPGYAMTPETHEQVCRGIQQAVEMVKTCVCYRAIPMDMMENGRGRGLPIDSLTDIFPDSAEDARYLAAYVATLGDVLETGCRKLAQQNLVYQSLLLDAVGTAMLDALGSVCSDMIEMHAQHMGLYSGCRKGPGLNGVAMEIQRLIFDLLGDDTADVHLNEALIMQPAKSISGFVLYTDTEQQKPKGNKCRQCEMKHCQFRSAQSK
ncbi:MAG: hypothetical protein JRE21_02510 [Deltaproteobacteria bacterium]|jgi:hypothetical protein|nr:hypothetical protein [Deltaproteobacteria bacterium]